MLVKLKGKIFYWGLRSQYLTWRIQIQGREHLDQLYTDKKRFLLCFWHGKYIPIFPLLEGYEACVVSSQSKRGSIITEICRNFGFQSTQIPDQPRRDSLKLFNKILTEVHATATAVDGPLGPPGRVKTGVIKMASAHNLVLLPVSVTSRWKIVLAKRWDRMEIPLPFTQIFMDFGEPVTVPLHIGAIEAKNFAKVLARTIDNLAHS
ncbi:MAG: hypothetical protein PF441_07695 [Desulfuromusa sp.]|jgi:lysophospholipid acyltransferase (LPLAT)-like uncharacterized protein|nr:hypothetical protein [Desulfuromusa sp.]